MAARHGERIGRIVLLGAAVAFPEPGRATFRGLAEKVEREGMAGVADVAVARMFPEDFIAAHPEIVAERRAVFLRIDLSVFAAAARSLATLDLSAELDLIRNPVLVVVGEKDGATPPGLGRALAERLPDARFIELPGIGHAPHIQAFDLLVTTIAPFLGLRGATRT
jgi:3-oxoadipate enol-lactonase